MMVASVGPYGLCTTAPVAALNRAATSGGNTSPPRTTARNAAHPDNPGTSATNAATVGTRSTIVTFSRAITSTNATGSFSIPGSAKTIRAPTHGAAHNSQIEGSNVNDVLCNTTSDADI